MTQEDKSGEVAQGKADISAEEAEVRQILSAGLSDLAKKSEPEKKPEEGSEAKAVAKDEAPSPAPDPAKKEDSEEKGETLRDILDGEQPVKIPTKGAKPILTEEDYKIDESGKVTVVAEHLYEDILDIRDKDARIFLKIFSAKNGREKAEVIAKSLGFEGDVTRSAGQYAKDVITAYVEAHRSGDAEKVNDIYDKLFPDALKNEEDANFSFAGKVAEKSDKKIVVDSEKGALPYQKKEFKDALSRFVDRNLYKHLDKNATKEDVEKVRSDLNEQLLDNSKFVEAIMVDRFDPRDGKRVSAEQALELAFEEVFGGETDSTKVSPVGGGSRQQSPTGERGKIDSETDQIRKILTQNLKR